LASVVIGGLISSTFLTLIVLPILYTYFDKKIKINKSAISLAFIMFFSIAFSSQAQVNINSAEQAFELALENNSSLKASELNIDQAKTEKGKSLALGKTEFFYNYDENNIAENGAAIGVFGIGQGFSFPGKYLSQSAFYNTQVDQQEQLNAHVILKSKKRIYQLYNNLNYLEKEIELYEDLIKIYSDFENASNLKFQLGENNFLEKLTAQSKKQEANLKLNQVQWRYREVYHEFKANLQIEDSLNFTFPEYSALDVKLPEMNTNPGIKYYEASILMSQKKANIEKQNLLPDFNIRYFQGSNRLPNAKLYQGIELGVAIPIWFKPQQTQIRQNLIKKDQLEFEKMNYAYQLESNLRKLKAKLERNKEGLSYYKGQGQELSKELVRSSEKAFKAGEIDYFEYVRVLDQAYYLKLNLIKSIFEFNETAIEIIYLTE
jgi:cobalt-zinc-cadmium resistance protein CzcA